MAKRGLNIRYKSRKRQRNKFNPTLNTDDSIKSFGVTLISVLLFLGLMALMTFGMSKMGVFQKGYTSPEEKETEFDYVNIKVSTVFNRSDKIYYVLFDDYKNGVPNSTYINMLLSEAKIPVYKVNMSLSENAKYKGETENKKATKPSELSINDVTLIRIVNGKIANYIVGRQAIEEYLDK